MARAWWISAPYEMYSEPSACSRVLTSSTCPELGSASSNMSGAFGFIVNEYLVSWDVEVGAWGEHVGAAG